MTYDHKKIETLKFSKYDSAGQYIDAVKNCKSLPNWDLKRDFSDDWAGGSLEYALNIAENGWSDGLKLVTQKMEVNKNQYKSKTRINDCAGDYPIVARAIAGLPDSMSRRVVRESVKKPVIDFLISSQASGSTDQGYFINFGAAIAMLVDSCESAGYSVSITAILAARSSVKDRLVHGAMFPVKKSGESLDLEKMIYFMAQPTFLRRLEFKRISSICEMHKEENNGMGSSRGMNDFLKEQGENDSILIAGWEHIPECKNVKAAMSILERVIKAQRPELIDTLDKAA